MRTVGLNLRVDWRVPVRQELEMLSARVARTDTGFPSARLGLTGCWHLNLQSVLEVR